jgi:hypothetical protein
MVLHYKSERDIREDVANGLDLVRPYIGWHGPRCPLVHTRVYSASLHQLRNKFASIGEQRVYPCHFSSEERTAVHIAVEGVGKNLREVPLGYLVLPGTKRE